MRYGILVLLALCVPAGVGAQQLRTDPVVGNLQRYGRTMKTDPDEGEGFSYHVYPAAHVAQASAPSAVDLAVALQMVQGNQAPSHAQTTHQGTPPNSASSAESASASQETQTQQFAQKLLLANALAGRGPSAFSPYSPVAFSPYASGAGIVEAAPFDSTRGLKNYSTPFGSPNALSDPLAVQAMLVAEATGVEGRTAIDLYHQPLIQIKLRVVEVARNDGLAARSVLEYVSEAGTVDSRTTGEPVNDGKRNLQGISDFVAPFADSLVTAAAVGEGAGALVNLTTEHINWALNVLATEFNGDVITAPEMVTLNGQNIEFVAGAKVPFHLGQNVTAGDTSNIQQFFYKNVGTYVSVTPKIVNWGLHGEGGGEATIQEDEITNWNKLASLLVDDQWFEPSSDDATLKSELALYAANTRPLPVELRERMLKKLNKYTRSALIGKPISTEYGVAMDGGVPGILQCLTPEAVELCKQCQWTPSDCTIELQLVVRLSDANNMSVTLDQEQEQAVTINFEDNVRAVANVIQISSGEGVVMAGLIGERDEESAEKVPVLGDLPVVGALFRSKGTLRQKTEVLIFVEAQVLDPRPEVARHQSAEDFPLSEPHVAGGLQDSPMALGMHRAGFGSYLPPARVGECIFWERNLRSIRKIRTHVDDILE